MSRRGERQSREAAGPAPPIGSWPATSLLHVTAENASKGSKGDRAIREDDEIVRALAEDPEREAAARADEARRADELWPLYRDFCGWADE